MWRGVFATLAVLATGFGIDRLAAAAGWTQAVHLAWLGLAAVLVGWMAWSLELARAEAATDGLTGAPNRRAFLAAADERLRRARRRGRPLTVVYIDVDDFKHVNDTLGHAVGDRVLRCVARTLRQTLREDDLFARLGGDEFVVLLDSGRPSPLVARLHNALRRQSAAWGLDVRFSLGAVTFPRVPDSAEDMLRRGDAAMYEAKEQGDRVVHRMA
jgi:diguanylate cyclase (GGDEF)-like protein